MKKVLLVSKKLHYSNGFTRKIKFILKWDDNKLLLKIKGINSIEKHITRPTSDYEYFKWLDKHQNELATKFHDQDWYSESRYKELSGLINSDAINDILRSVAQMHR